MIAPSGADLGTILGVWAHPDDEADLSSLGVEEFLPVLHALGAFRDGAKAPVLTDDEIDLEQDWSRAMARESFRLAESRSQ